MSNQPEDVRRALAGLSARASRHPQYALKISFPPHRTWEDVLADPGPMGFAPDRSALLTGREIYLSLEGEGSDHLRLGLLWGLTIPLGFRPWSRYPEPSPLSMVFHCWGPWRVLEDNLLASGRGEAAWPSLCAAGQCEAGTWGGNAMPQRKLQAHLHRLGFSCGPIDGVVGPLTKKAMAAAGLGSSTLEQALENLQSRSAPEPKVMTPRRGRLEIDAPIVVHTTGSVRAIRTPKGASLTVTGEGRIIVDVGV